MIRLPALFENVLAAKPSLSAGVRKSLDLFEPWLEQSGMPLFPGFTDHSPRHIQDVLQTAASIISDASRASLSPEDVAVLSIAILLHDCGMHLTQDGFRTISMKKNPPAIMGLGDRPWLDLWRDFLAEAQRFGEERLIAIFGDAEPLRSDALRPDNLSERDCLLVGEFVRRHHARLAHEIAVAGVPRTSSGMLELVGLDADLKDLAGLVARSHGMPIRNTFEYLENRYGLIPEYRHIKVPYLMAVLRIADYIQVQSERAIRTLLSVKELRSPISRQEWRAHFAVKDVSTRHEDPEALYVHATPTDVRTYLKLTSLFKDIQRELDESWATLGEVYGRQHELSQLGLTIRRVRSNLDASDRFARTVQYIPLKAAFATSGPELLKLLVGPLYAYESRVGVRELVQNAVDACRELEDLQRSNGSVPPSLGSDVTVEFDEAEDGRGWLTITDRGVGMTLETVTGYFLVAGASFRNSDIWKKQHTDNSGEVRPLRGGRFGVGVLAAFLLGEEIHVRTRHISRDETDGLEFRARIDDAMIELRRCAGPVGTSIRVWISDTLVLNRLRPDISSVGNGKQLIQRWQSVDWFRQSKPSVLYRWNGFAAAVSAPARGQNKLSLQFATDCEAWVPADVQGLDGWQQLQNPTPYKAVFWRYVKPKKQRENDKYQVQLRDEITVNGIFIQDVIGNRSSEYGYTELSAGDLNGAPRFHINRPSIAILDPAGLCPINLQRNSVSFRRMDIDGRLARSIVTHYVQYLRSLSCCERTPEEFQKLCGDSLRYDGLRFQGQLAPICYTVDGYVLAAPSLLRQQKIHTLFFLALGDLISLHGLEPGEAVLLRTSVSGRHDVLAWFRAVHGRHAGFRWYLGEVGFPAVLQTCSVSMVSSDKWKLITTKRKVNRKLLKTIKSAPVPSEKVIASSGDAAESAMLVDRVKEISERLGSNVDVSAWRLGADTSPASEPPLLVRSWLEVFGQATMDAACQLA